MIRSRSQFWSILYIPRLSLSSPAASHPLAPFTPCATSNTHPVNYFVSGYLQRAVNSCRADYTDRFIALVSQSNVRNAPLPATHAHPQPFSGLPEFPSSSFTRTAFIQTSDATMLGELHFCCDDASGMSEHFLTRI